MRRWTAIVVAVLAAQAAVLAVWAAQNADQAEPPAVAAPPGPVAPPPLIPEVEAPTIAPPTGTPGPVKPIPPVGDDPFAIGEEPPLPEPAPGLVEEGKRIFNREGRLGRDEDGAMVFVFDSGDKPMRLLENSHRQRMELLSRGGTEPLRFRISGLVTVYRDHNYLLASKVVRIRAEEENM